VGDAVPQKNTVPQKHHLDRRVDSLLAVEGEDDDLLTTRELADWFGVSPQWPELARHYKWGPPYIKLGPRQVRYRRTDVMEWLRSRRKVPRHSKPKKDKRITRAKRLSGSRLSGLSPRA
jgi:predicted DNA-binding transcriptional regulator AlpA